MGLKVDPPGNITYNTTSLNTGNNSSILRETPTEMAPPLYIYLYVTAINALVFFVGVFGNALVIQVVATVRSMRKRMNYFLVSLSVADLMVLLVGLPVALHEFYGKEKWYLGAAMCKIVPFMENASHHCSVLTLLAIGFERYYAICHPLRETLGSRVASTTILLPAIWIISCGVSIPFAIISKIKMSEFYDDTIHPTCQTSTEAQLYRDYIILISVVLLGLPLLLLTALYSAIIRTLRSSTATEPNSTNSGTHGRQNLFQNNVQNARTMASRRQVVRMMVGVMILYFVCLVPLRCFQLWAVFGKESEKETLGFEGFMNILNCVRILVFVNSAGNPIIYSLLSSNFRAAFRQLFTRGRSNQGRNNTYNSKYYNHNSHPQQESTVLETTRLDRMPSIRPTVVAKEKVESETSKCLSSPAMSNSRNSSTAACSHNSVDRVMAPLLSQTEAARKDADAVTFGYQQMKPGLAYV